MDSPKLPALLALVGVVVAVGLFLVLKDDTADEDSVTNLVPAQDAGPGPADDGRQGGEPPKPEEPELPLVEVQGGKPVGGVQELEFKSGDSAVFEVRSDEADELHLHGYDLYFDLRAGKPSQISFSASIEGLFDLESHTTGEPLAEISVVP